MIFVFLSTSLKISITKVSFIKINTKAYIKKNKAADTNNVINVPRLRYNTQNEPATAKIIATRILLYFTELNKLGTSFLTVKYCTSSTIASATNVPMAAPEDASHGISK